MLRPALEDPDPVLIFENATLYNRKGTLQLTACPSISTGPGCAGPEVT